MCLKNVLVEILRERHENTWCRDIDLVSCTVHQDIAFLISNGEFNIVNDIFTGHRSHDVLPFH